MPNRPLAQSVLPAEKAHQVARLLLGTDCALDPGQLYRVTIECSCPSAAQSAPDEREAFEVWWNRQLDTAKRHRPGDDWIDLNEDDKELYDAAFQAGAAWQRLKAAATTKPAAHSVPYPDGTDEALERTDWTPEQALRWYAEGRHFDTVDGRTRIIDTGAIASNALKHASLEYLELKGDAALTELREQASWQRAQSAPVVPEGWRLVPDDMTPEMYTAFCETRGIVGTTYKDGWRAALAAAPQPAAQHDQGDDTARLDNLERLKEYVVGFAPSGDWSVFSAKDRRTCYGKTIREALDKMVTMHAALSASAEGKV